MTSPQPDLLSPPDSIFKDAIVKALWGTSIGRVSEAYWDFYVQECQHALEDNGKHTSVRSHQDILDVIFALKGDRSRQEVRDMLRSKLTMPHDNEDEILDNSIDLAARLLLMIGFGDIYQGFSAQRRLDWNSSGSLRDFLALNITQKIPSDQKGIRINRTLNAQTLARIVGLSLVPTSNLLDHLRLINNDTQVYIFYHASFLKCQDTDSLFPKGFVQETQDTLALLFPRADIVVRGLARSLSESIDLDPELIRCGQLKMNARRLERFSFWQDRLLILNDLYNEATPQTLSDWWYDRRDSVQWYTFWVAILVLVLTIVFGLIQSITGIMQVYAAYHPSIET